MQRRAAFSLVQLIVILAIVLMLLGLLVSAAFRVRQAADSSIGFNNLKQLGLATHNFHDVFKAFPPIYGGKTASPATIHFHLLPYIEQDALYSAAEGKMWHKGVSSTPVSVYLDTSDKSAPPGNKFNGWLATTNYAANWLAFKTGDRRLTNITDGTSNTFMFTQRYQVCNGTPTAWGYPGLYTWTPMFAYYSQAKFQSRPKQADCDPTLPQSIQEGGIQTVFCDGAARMISDSVSPQNWWALTTPDGGEVVNFDE